MAKCHSVEDARTPVPGELVVIVVFFYGLVPIAEMYIMIDKLCPPAIVNERCMPYLVVQKSSGRYAGRDIC